MTEKSRHTKENRFEASEGQFAKPETRFSAIFENSPTVNGIARLSDQCFTEVNSAFLTFFGYSRAEVIGHSGQELGLWGNLQDREQMIALMATQHRVRDFETIVRKKDGSLATVLLSGEMVSIEGEPSLVIQLVDITRLRQAEEQSRVFNERFTELADNTLDVFWISDAKLTSNIYTSPAFEKIVGLRYDQVEQLPDGYLSIVHPDDRDVVRQLYQPDWLGEPFEIQYRIKRPDGSVRWLREKGTPVFDADGQVARMVGVTTDVTDVVESTRQLQESEERFRQMADNIQEVFWMFDNRTQQIVYISQAYEAIWGRTTQSLYDSPRQYIEVIHPDDRGVMFAALERQALGEATEMEYRIIRPDGTVRWIFDRSFPIFDAQGNLIRTTGIAADQTERKLADQEIRQRQKRLEQVIRLGQTITAIVDLPACLRAIHRIVREELNFERAGLFLYDPVSDTIRGVHGTDRDGQYETLSWFEEPAVSVSAWRLALENPLWMDWSEDYQSDYNPSPGDSMYGVRQHASLAAWAGDRPVALIAVDNLLTQRPITAVDLEALQLFAGYAGLAIANAQLHAGLEQRVKERTEALLQSEATYRALFETSNDGIFILSSQGFGLEANPQALKMIGYTLEEYQALAQLDHDPVIQQGQHQDAAARFAAISAGEDVPLYERTLVAKDGHEVAVEIRLSAVRDADGRVKLIQSVVRDISNRKKAEAALRESEEQNRLLFNESPEPVHLLDPQGQIVRANRAYAALLGLPVETLLGANAYELGLVDEQTRQRLSQAYNQALSAPGGAVAAVQHSLCTADGSLREVESRLHRLVIGGADWVLVTTRDITAQKEAEEALRRANAEMERSLRLKDEFLASMSHELRTPLTGILGMAEVLEAGVYGSLNERQLRAAHTIQQSGQHLLDLINDILDLSKIDAGKEQIALEPVDVSEVCQASLRLVREIAEKKRQIVSFSVSPAGMVVRGDARRITQILVNLLSNAVKFTPVEGELGLSVSSDPMRQVVRFSVWDKGIGIAEEDLSKLFKPFVQLDSSLARKYEGTGLGLSLTARLAELHGGSVEVESVPGEGSRFTVVLPRLAVEELAGDPAAPAETAPRLDDGMSAPADEAPERKTILLVEDNEFNIRTISDYLAASGYQVLVARTGVEALEQTMHYRPHLILMDIQMPGMDGLQATRSIRRLPDRDLADTYIIVVTALAMPGDRERSLAAGANDYLSKPINLKELSALIRKALNG